MTGGNGERESRVRSPEEAFSVLGNETRTEILRILGEADEPLSFSDLYDRVGMVDSGNFTYHLDKVTGHFVRKTVGGYELRRAGHRVVEAVRSGAVTDEPVLERTEIGEPCYICGAASIEVCYREGQIGMFCPSCRGMYAGSSDPDERSVPSEQERLGYLHLPPAGTAGRTPEEMLHASFTWVVGELGMAVNGVCPRCAAPVVSDPVEVCPDHDPGDALCDRCGRRYAATVQYRCTNCVYVIGGVLGVIRLLPDPDVRAFLVDHGFDPVAPQSAQFWNAAQVYDEEILGTDPFEARYTFTVDGDSLSLTVDDDLSVVEVAENTSAEIT